MRGRRILVTAYVVVFVAVTCAIGEGHDAAATTTAGSVGVDADQGGTSWYPNQTALTPQLVQGGSFGQLFASQLQGDIQAQPLVEDGVLLVETEENWAYGLDPATGVDRMVEVPGDAVRFRLHRVFGFAQRRSHRYPSGGHLDQRGVLHIGHLRYGNLGTGRILDARARRDDRSRAGLASPCPYPAPPRTTHSSRSAPPTSSSDQDSC